MNKENYSREDIELFITSLSKATNVPKNMWTGELQDLKKQIIDFELFDDAAREEVDEAVGALRKI